MHVSSRCSQENSCSREEEELWSGDGMGPEHIKPHVLVCSKQQRQWRNWKPSGCQLPTTLLISTKDMVTDSQNVNMVPLRTGNGWGKVTNTAVYFFNAQKCKDTGMPNLVPLTNYKTLKLKSESVEWTHWIPDTIVQCIQVGTIFSSSGSKAFKEVKPIIESSYLLRDITKLSDAEQTSALEGYHKVVISFAPKHTHFFYGAMEARWIFISY